MSPTISDLLTLHDLDLGALAHKVGVTGENFTTAHVEVLCEGFTTNHWARYSETLHHSFLPIEERARRVAALGAKVRAALSQPTIAVDGPRTLTLAEINAGAELSRDRSPPGYENRIEDYATQWREYEAARNHMACGRYLGDNMHCARAQQPGTAWCRQCGEELEQPVRSAAFVAHLEKASGVVAQMPEWKQSILGGPLASPVKPRP